MLSGEPQSRPGMQHARHGQPADREPVQTVPVEAMAWAALPPWRAPQTGQPSRKGEHAVEISRYRIIIDRSELHNQPTYPPVCASLPASRHRAQNSVPSGSLLLSREDLSSSAFCRFIPAHNSLSFHQHCQREVLTPFLSSTSRETCKRTFFLHVFSITSPDYPSFPPPAFFHHPATRNKLTIFVSMI